MKFLVFDRLALSVCAAVATLSGCGGAQPSIVVPAAAQSIRVGHTIIVKPGESIQAAVDQAVSGETVVVEPGKYRETGRICPFDRRETCAVSIVKNAISLIANSAKNPVILENSNGLTNGIAVGRSSRCSANRVGGSRVSGFVVRGFSGSGITLSCADHWEVAYNNAFNNALYGVHASYSRNSRLHDNVAQLATRAGIHVGLSEDVTVDHNVAHDNVMGFELRESIDSTLDRNTAFRNTAGIFELIMPGDPLERNYRNTVSDNIVQRNNRANKCSVPSDPVCLIRPGVGIVIAGGASNRNLLNHVIGNVTFGIAVIDVCSAFEIPTKRCNKLRFDPLPRSTQTERNVTLQNGVDLLWSANGTGNCWLKNQAKIRAPKSLPQCPGSSAITSLRSL